MVNTILLLYNRFDTSIEYNVITTKKQNNEYINLLFASWLTFVT